jgi:hypothetical protein
MATQMMTLTLTRTLTTLEKLTMTTVMLMRTLVEVALNVRGARVHQIQNQIQPV